MPADEDPMVAVIDIDGVVADVRHRLQHVTGRPKNWRAFFAGAADDPLLDEGAETVRQLATAYQVVYLSGRPEGLRAVTERWFAQHDLPPGRLILRPPGDFRPARFFKVEQLQQLSATRTVVVPRVEPPSQTAYSPPRGTRTSVSSLPSSIGKTTRGSSGFGVRPSVSRAAVRSSTAGAARATVTRRPFGPA